MSPRPAPDKLYDLESVPGFRNGRLPLGPWQDLEVPLDRDPLGRQPQFPEQLRDTRSGWNLSRLAIDHDRDVRRHARLSDGLDARHLTDCRGTAIISSGR